MEPDTTTSIVVAEPKSRFIVPLMTAAEAQKRSEDFMKLKEALLSKSDYMKDKQGRTYIRKTGFRKLMFAFGLSDRIISEERVERDDGTFYWRVTVEVYAQNGQSATGAAICDSKEKENKSLPGQLEHNTYTMAHTRAKNRAVSDLVAGGEVSAEEMDAAESAAADEQPQSPPAPTRPKISPKTVPRKNSEERVFEFRGAGPESGPEMKDDPHPF